jgi:hypothetical protein
MKLTAHRYLYKDFVLSCAPLETDDGRFQSRVAITYIGGVHTRSQRFLDLQFFDNEDDAAEHGRLAGIEWVDANVGS